MLRCALPGRSQAPRRAPPVAPGEGHRLNLQAHFQLREDGPDLGADGVLGHHAQDRYLPHTTTRHQVGKNLPLLGAQPFEPAGSPRLPTLLLAVQRDEPVSLRADP
jgi:hypothetical protein